MSQQWGGIFENAVIEEIEKRILAQGQIPRLSFWRDSNGLEADLVVEKGGEIIRLVEIKASSTYNPKFFSALSRVGKVMDLPTDRQIVVYSGSDSAEMAAGSLMPLADAYTIGDLCTSDATLPWSR